MNLLWNCGVFQVEEVGAANKEHAQLTANKPTVQPLFKVYQFCNKSFESLMNNSISGKVS